MKGTKKVVRITGGPDPRDLRVFVDDMEISRNLTAIRFIAGVNETPQITFEFINAELDVDVEIWD